MAGVRQKLSDELTLLACSLRRRIQRVDAAREPSCRGILIPHYPPTLGAILHQTPLYEALRRRHPEATIMVASSNGLVFDTLRHSPFVDYLIDVPNPLHGLRQSATELQRALRQIGSPVDCVLTGAFDRRRATVRLGYVAGQGWLGGFTEDASLCRHPLVFDEAQSVIANNLRVAALAGAETTPLEPSIFFSAADLRYAEAQLQRARDARRPVLIVISQGSGGPGGGWHEDRFAEAIRHAEERLGYMVFYDGAEKDVAAVESLRTAAGGRGVSLAGRTRVTQLAAMMALGDLVLALDTGTLHIGRAMNVPMVMLAPSWQMPHSWLPPAAPHRRLLQGPYRRGHGDDYRLDEIALRDVTGALDELTDLFPADPAARERRVARGLSQVDRLPGPSSS